MNDKKIIDSHVHCSASSIGLLKNTMDECEISSALVIPFPGKSMEVLEAANKAGLKGLYFAYSPQTSYASTKELDNDLCLFYSNQKYFSALKFYKDFNFGKAEFKGTSISLLSDVVSNFSNAAIESNKRIIVHIADPSSFWDWNPHIRQKQMQIYPELNMKNSSISKNELIKQALSFLKNKENIVQLPHLGWFPHEIEEARFILKNYVVDTSASIEELIYLYGAGEISKLILEEADNVLFGSDLIIGDVQHGKDKIYTHISIQYVKQTLLIFKGKGEILNIPNYREIPWKIESLTLDEKIINALFHGNFETHYNIKTE